MDYRLRPWRKSDLPSLVRYANNREIAKNLTDKFPFPYSAADGQALIQFATAAAPTEIFAIEIQGETAGSIGIHPQMDVHRKNAELGYWLAVPFWGRGIATRAVREMVIYVFETFDINRIYARPFGSNLASHRVLEKAGFFLEARLEKTIYKKDRIEDELIYAIRRKRDLTKGQNPLEPQLHPGEVVFIQLETVGDMPLDEVICFLRESEGVTAILRREIADRLSLTYKFVAAWITLNVYSSLEAVGLTARFSTALARNDIPANVVAGYHHDHIFVPVRDGQRAHDLLKHLTTNSLQ
jgi:ribosomal-protein-alanine N-acetyltransferase